LKDWRRINVSFTRAKSKLVIFGSRKTLEGDQLLKGFVELMSGKGWIYNLPKGADTLHCAEGLKEEEQVGSSTGIGRHRKLSKDGKGKGSVAGLLGSKPFAKDILAVSESRKGFHRFLHERQANFRILPDRCV